MGCKLLAINRDAYPELPDEVQMVWGKKLKKGGVMAIPTDEEIKKWRERWEKYPGLGDEIASILRGEEPGDTSEEAAQRLWEANRILGVKGGDDFEVYKGSGVKLTTFSIPIPPLDLKGINWENEDLPRITLKLAHMEGAILSNANFEGSSFWGAHLVKARLDNVNFRETTLIGAHLEGALFVEIDSFYEFFFKGNIRSSHLDEKVIRGILMGRIAKLEGASLNNAFLEGTNFGSASIAGADFGGASIGRFVSVGDAEHSSSLRTEFLSNSFLPRYRDLIGSKKRGNECFRNGWRLWQWEWSRMWRLYMDRWNYTNFAGVNIEDAGTALSPDLRRYVEDQRFVHRVMENSPMAYWIWNLTTACGWSSIRLLVWAILIIIGFASLYAHVPNLIQVQDSPGVSSWMQWFYASFDIFTNLGIRVTTKPASNWGVVVMFIETIMGWMALGLAITVFANKYARRS